MALRPNPRSGGNSAESTVFDNLGLTQADLGMGDDGDDDNDSQVDSQDSQQREDEGDSQQRVTHTDDRDDLSTQRGADQQAQQAREQRQQQQPRPFGQRAEVRPDRRGNLVDHTGRIVARAGAEARLYQRAHRAEQGLESTRAHAEDTVSRLNRAVEIGQGLYAEVEQYKAREKQISDFGLSSDEHLQALQFAAQAKTNPVETLKRLLTMAASRGIDLTQLGIANNGGIDAKALTDTIRAEVSQLMNPLRERSQQEQQQAQAQQDEQSRLGAATHEVTTFFRENPDAVQHVPVFHAIIQRFPNMSLGEVWARIQLNLAQTRGQRPGNRRSPPSGRGTLANGGAPLADVDESYDSILNKVLDEVGVARR